MQKAASTSRFLIDLSLEQRFVDSESIVIHDNPLQSIVLSRFTRSANSRQLFGDLVRTFIRLAEHSYNLRDKKGLEEASRVLMNLPLAKARQVGLFYQALTLKRTGQTDEARLRFELIANNGQLAHRARAIQALGALHYDRGEPAEALRFQLEAARTTSDGINQNPLDKLMVQLEISHIQAHLGDHQRALSGLERLASLVRFVAKEYPLYFYVYHNALAVEFGELGRLAEAEGACAIALASPFAHAYPEWSETRDEIAAKRQAASRSVVAIHRAPEAERAPQAKSQRNAKPVVRFVSGYQASDKDFFQRSVLLVPAIVAIALNAVSILGRVLICVGPRAPPARS
jgi:hypothetical protein